MGSSDNRPDDNRRDFIRGSSFLLASALPAARLSPLSDLRLGLVGCDRAGITLLNQALVSNPHARVVALADPMPNQVQQAFRALKGRHSEQFLVKHESKFSGRHAATEILGAKPDAIIVSAPPSSEQLETIIHAVGEEVHCFVESPIWLQVAGLLKLRSSLGAQPSARFGLEGRQPIHERFPEASQAISQGQIGQPRRIDAVLSSTIPKWLLNSSGANKSDNDALKSYGLRLRLERNVNLLDWSLRTLGLSESSLSLVGQSTVEYAESSVFSKYEFRSGSLVLNSEIRLTPEKSATSDSIRVFGEHGDCELNSGVLTSDAGQFLGKFRRQSGPRANALNGFLQDLTSGQPYAGTQDSLRLLACCCVASMAEQLDSGKSDFRAVKN